MLRVIGRWEQTNSGGYCQLPFLCDRATKGGAVSLVYCIVEHRVLGNGVVGRGFGPGHTSSPHPAA